MKKVLGLLLVTVISLGTKAQDKSRTMTITGDRNITHVTVNCTCGQKNCSGKPVIRYRNKYIPVSGTDTALRKEFNENVSYQAHRDAAQDLRDDRQDGNIEQLTTLFLVHDSVLHEHEKRLGEHDKINIAQTSFNQTVIAKIASQQAELGDIKSNMQSIAIDNRENYVIPEDNYRYHRFGYDGTLYGGSSMNSCNMQIGPDGFYAALSLGQSIIWGNNQYDMYDQTGRSCGRGQYSGGQPNWNECRGNNRNRNYGGGYQDNYQDRRRYASNPVQIGGGRNIRGHGNNGGVRYQFGGPVLGNFNSNTGGSTSSGGGGLGNFNSNTGNRGVALGNSGGGGGGRSYGNRSSGGRGNSGGRSVGGGGRGAGGGGRGNGGGRGGGGRR